MFLSAGALTSRKVDRGVDRNRDLVNVVRNPASLRGTPDGDQNAAIDRLDAAASSMRAIGANAFAALRARDPADIATFMDRFDKLSPEQKTELQRLLHFGGGGQVANVFNYRRTTSLNTARLRNSVRNDGIDEFIKSADDPSATSNDALLARLKAVRAESLGSRGKTELAPLADYIPGDDREARQRLDELDRNVKAAVSRLIPAEQKKFVTRYVESSDEDRSQLRDIMHFDSLRFWKSDSTLATTKYPRAEIRETLASRFADGTSLARLAELKPRLSTKAIPVKTSGTEAKGRPEHRVLKRHIEAFQHANLAALGEEKRYAKMLMTYGAANMVGSAVELGLNPAYLASAGQLSATRAFLGPANLMFLGHRGVVGAINAENARPMGPAIRDEALKLALPQLDSLLNAKSSPTAHFKTQQEKRTFLDKTLGLSQGDIREFESLEKQGDHAGARKFLSEKSPENNVLLALHKLAQQCKAADGSADKQAALQLVEAEAAARSGSGLGDIRNKTDDEAFNALRHHFLGNPNDGQAYVGVAHDPERGLNYMARKIGEGHRFSAAFDVGGTEGMSESDIKDKLTRRLAENNPAYAVKLFTSHLHGTGANRTEARNMLRDIRFTERDLADLDKMSRKDAASYLEGHLFGENLRRRFSDIPIDKSGRAAADTVVRTTTLPLGTEDEPLTWRRELENSGLKVIDNQASPGIDSMLTALYQSFAGNSAPSPHDMNHRIMEARQATLRKLTTSEGGQDNGGAGTVAVDMENPRHLNAIIHAATRHFGKAGAAVTIARTGGAQTMAIGANGTGGAPAAVLCYDTRTQRSFALTGTSKPSMPASTVPPSSFNHGTGMESYEPQPPLPTILEKTEEAAVPDAALPAQPASHVSN